MLDYAALLELLCRARRFKDRHRRDTDEVAQMLISAIKDAEGT